MNAKYASYGDESGDNSGSSGDYGDDEQLTFKWNINATFRGVLDSVFGADTQYGQTLGLKFRDAKVVDGVLMARLNDDGNRDGTVKLLPWSSMPVRQDGDISADDAPELYTEDILGNTYRYELLAARVEGEDGGADPVEIGADIVLWEGGGKAPSATAKVMAQIFTQAGPDVIVDRDDINNWLTVNNIDARPELLDREFDVFKVEKKGEEHSFHSPIVVDTKTQEQVKVSQRAEGSTSGSSDSASEASGTSENGDTGSDAPVGNGVMAGPVVDFVEFCTDFGLDDEAQILDNLHDMAGDSSNDLTKVMVDEAGEDAILAEILG